MKGGISQGHIDLKGRVSLKLSVVKFMEEVECGLPGPGGRGGERELVLNESGVSVGELKKFWR